MKLCTIVLTTCTLLASVASAKPCVNFDSHFNLYVFGGAKDVSLGPQDNWRASTVSTGSGLTFEGRPPFNGPNTQCFLAQYFNAMYVLNADTTQPGNLHIYDFGSQTWTTQAVDDNGVDPNQVIAILDRNTNVLFGLSNGEMYELHMDDKVAAQQDKIGWNYVGKPPWAENYPDPVLALGQNHIHYLNLGSPGFAAIFVVHFAFFQVEWQEFPGIDGRNPFPSARGSAVSLFRSPEEDQIKFAFIPEDGSNTFVVDVVQNNTATMSGPNDKSAGSVYAGGQSAIAQLTSSGDVYWIPFNNDDTSANSAASWSRINLDTTLFSAPFGTITGSGTATGTVPNATGTSGSSRTIPLAGRIHLAVVALAGISLWGLI